ncbi:MAG: hypothetical protein LBU39_02330 [Desulfobulbaceae bacterium]|jgi:competence protein ComEC|nr:hypothetical protein [Desulfobulbaceae bacterium]
MRRAGFLKAAVAVTGFTAFFAASVCLAATPLTISFVDVGHGNATLFYQPGSCAMLVDAGPAEQGENLRELLEKYKIKTLDYMVVTSPAPEYYFGLNIILSDVTIKELSDNGDPGRDGFDEYRQLQERIPYSVVAAGDSWQCGDVKVNVLNPPVEIAESPDRRSRSLALMISFGRFRMLMMNDLAGRGERELLARDHDLQAMVLTIGNHGAADGTSSQLLARVRPRMAVASVGRDRRLLLPAESVVSRIKGANIHLYTTRQSGTISLKVQPDGSARLARQ